jgi:5-methyltetrahydrofolate--homocysteine methyltransferase
MAKNDALFTAISKGKKNDVIVVVQKMLAEGVNAEAILTETMIPAMRDIGDKFSRNEVYVPEMLIAARAMQAGLTIIEPILVKAGHKPLGKVAIGTVKGDLHDIGKNLVAMMLKGAGFEVKDLGVDCTLEKFKGAVDQGAQVVLCSALLTTTMPYMKTVVEGLRGTNAKVVIGGAPVTKQYADEIGAQGYGSDANDAVKIVEQCLGLTA